jgi:hypothetical protein
VLRGRVFGDEARDPLHVWVSGRRAAAFRLES